MKLKKCTSSKGRHTWEFEGNIILKTMRQTATHITVNLSTRGKYFCATCGAKKYGASHITLGGDAAS